ncbi:MAG: FAD-binding oxidoreductase, partial [Thermoleophilaceae bacterium]|nr:FAD-binding oxidoreductase [Thermoleophilaceae bacterium]
MAAMKWWGWGREDVSFTHEDKPGLAPFIREKLNLDVTRPGTASAVALEELELADPVLPDALRSALTAAVGGQHVSTDRLDRVVHARGKSLSDLVRQRRGAFPRLPDVVVRPGDEGQVAALVHEALQADAVVIPFGGGSSISGSLEAAASEKR